MKISSGLMSKAAFVLIAVIFIFTTAAYGAVHQPIIAFTYLLITALGVVWILAQWQSGELTFSRNPMQTPILGAAIFGFIQIIPFGTMPQTGGIEGISRSISIAPFDTQISAINFVALLGFFAVTLACLNSAARLRNMALVMIGFGFCFAFFSVLQSVLSPNSIFGIYSGPWTDPFGSFISRNNFSGWIDMALGIPLGILFAGGVAKDRRLLYITAVAMMGTALLLSKSRGGLAAFVAEVLLIVFVTIRGKGARRLALRVGLAAGIFCSIVAGAIFVGGDTTFSRLGETSTRPEVTRPHIWSVTLRVIGDSLPLGTGLGAFGTAYTRFDESSGLARVEQAHNDYLQAVADAGIIGGLLLAAFIYFVFLTGRKALKNKDRFQFGLAAGCLGSIVSIAVQSLFDFPLHTMALAIFFLLIAAILDGCTRNYTDVDPSS